MSLIYPLFTDTYTSISSFQPEANSSFLYSSGEEDRSQLPKDWMDINGLVNFIRLDDCEYSFEGIINGHISRIALRAQDKIAQFLNSLPGNILYIDITGMGHNIWAPILKSALQRTPKKVCCVYAEPRSYRFSDVPTEGTIFDLSEKIKGIEPLPGFSNFREPEDGKEIFIPLLGFEGARFAYILQTQEPSPPIIPIIGIPGFMMEYPFYTYWGNKNVLQKQLWKDVRYTSAFCPFSLYYELIKLKQNHQDHFFRLAPIGTKPHGLGAILFSIFNHDFTEIIYDNPIRKGGRTTGQSRIHVYNITDFKNKMVNGQHG